MADNINRQNLNGAGAYVNPNRNGAKQPGSTETINLMEIAELILSNWLPIFIVGVVFAVAGFLGVKFFTVPSYVSSSTLYINTERENVSDDVNTKSLIDTQSLMPTYVKILNSKSFLKSVCEKMDNKYVYSQVSGMISVSEVEETNLMTISVRSTDAYDAYMICKYIIESAPEEIYRVFEGGSVKVIDQPELSSTPIKKSASKSALMAFMLGALLMAAFFVIKDMMDTRIKNPDELSARYGVPILGEAPDFEADQKG